MSGWTPPWRGMLGAQWVAPIAKAPPPLPVSPVPILVPPPPPGLSPQVRSEKRRKLQEHTADILREPWTLNSDLVALQENCFQEYEKTIQNLNSKLLNRDSCIQEQKQNIITLNGQLRAKSNLLRKKQCETYSLNSCNLQLQTQIETLTMRLATDASEHQETVQHYKSLVKGLQKSVEESEIASGYLNCMKALLHNHSEGETIENAHRTSDRVCSICMENKANIVCSPCMHMEYCTSCALTTHGISMGAFHENKMCSVESKCPRCKGDVSGLLYIFT